MDNLYNLTLFNPNQEETTNNSFRLWKTQSNEGDCGIKYVNIALFAKAYTNSEEIKSVVYTNETFENLKIENRVDPRTPPRIRVHK